MRGRTYITGLIRIEVDFNLVVDTFILALFEGSSQDFIRTGRGEYGRRRIQFPRQVTILARRINSILIEIYNVRICVINQRSCQRRGTIHNLSGERLRSRV